MSNPKIIIHTDIVFNTAERIMALVRNLIETEQITPAVWDAIRQAYYGEHVTSGLLEPACFCQVDILTVEPADD